MLRRLNVESTGEWEMVLASLGEILRAASLGGTHRAADIGLGGRGAGASAGAGEKERAVVPEVGRVPSLGVDMAEAWLLNSEVWEGRTLGVVGALLAQIMALRREGCTAVEEAAQKVGPAQLLAQLLRLVGLASPDGTPLASSSTELTAMEAQRESLEELCVELCLPLLDPAAEGSARAKGGFAPALLELQDQILAEAEAETEAGSRLAMLRLMVVAAARWGAPIASVLSEDWPLAMLIVARARRPDFVSLAVSGLACYFAHARPAAATEFSDSGG